ncbi:MAG: hypothetical protein RLZZ479_393 [Bacteroidota bacterium]|jgi:hypothetical protein
MKLHITENNWKIVLEKNKNTSNLGNVKKELYKRKDLHNLIIENTSFCNSDTDIKIRITYILNELTEMNICKECNTLINDGGKKMFCSHSCRAFNQAKDLEIKRKRSESYSNTYSMLSETEKNEIKTKRKNTLQEKYGVNHNFKIEGFKESRAKTWKIKYGNEIAQKSDIVKEKAKNTCKEKYGGPNPLSDKNVKEKWLSSFNQKYNTSNPMHVDIFKRKMLASKLGIDIEDVKFISEKLINQEILTLNEYIKLVRILTEETLINHGNAKFGNNWEIKRGKMMYHIDHSLSIRSCFEMCIDPLIASHIANLEFIPFVENLSKGATNSITYEELQLKINEYEKTKTS